MLSTDIAELATVEENLRCIAVVEKARDYLKNHGGCMCGKFDCRDNKERDRKVALLDSLIEKMGLKHA